MLWETCLKVLLISIIENKEFVPEWNVCIRCTLIRGESHSCSGGIKVSGWIYPLACSFCGLGRGNTWAISVHIIKAVFWMYLKNYLLANIQPGLHYNISIDNSGVDKVWQWVEFVNVHLIL